MEKILRRVIPGNFTWRKILLESCILLGVYILWLILRPADSSGRALIGSLAVVVPIATAGLLIIWAQPLIEKTTRYSWKFLGAGLLCWLIGNFVRTYYLVLQNDPMPIISAADVFNFLGYPFLLLALIAYPYRSRYLPSRFRFLLDATISSTVVAALGWLVIARPAAQAMTGSFINLLPLVYPVADLVLIMVLINTILANPLARRISFLWGVSLLAFLISDYVYSYKILIQDYQAGGIESLGWTIGSLLFGLSIVVEATAHSKKEEEEYSIDTGVRIQTILPIVLGLVLIWFVLADWRLRGEPSVFGIWLAILMGLSLIVRLGVRAGEVELHRYWQLFNGLAEPTFICDTHGKVVVANPALVRLFGEESERLIVNRNLDSVFRMSKRSQKVLERAAQTATSVEVSFANSRIPFLLSLSPIFMEDRKILIAGVAYDLSDEKKQQEALKKANDDLRLISQRLEELNTQLEEKVSERTKTLQRAFQRLEEQNKMLQTLDQLKTDFVSMVSHELRTPLTSLNGGLELLMAHSGRRPEDLKTMGLMKNEVERLTHFVENMLNLSAIEAGRLEPHVESVDVNLMVQDVLRSMKTIPGASRIVVNFPDALPHVLADEGFIHSVLNQLLDNALKYAAPSPVIIDVLQFKSRMRIRITDKGPGIPVDKRKQLFKRFQRFNAGDSQAIYGFGLGLFYSKQLLLSINSKLCYEAPPDGGACFYFDLKVIQ